MSAPRSWFGEHERAACADLWRVLRTEYPRAWALMVARAEEHARHGVVFRRREGQAVATQGERMLEALRLGFEANDWSAYEGFVRERAATYAPQGLNLDVWFTFTQVLGDAMTIPLVEAYGADPQRLARAGGALRKFLSRSIEEVAGEYFRRETATLAETTHALADSERQLRAFAGRLERAREGERTRIAREMHDELGQRLTSLKLDISWLLKRMTDAKRSDELTERLEAMGTLVESTVAVVKQLATELRPGVLDELGLKDAIDWQARDFQARSGIQVDLELSRWPARLQTTSDQATALFRAFQELLTNVARHSGATRVQALLEVREGRAVLEVRDNGRGIDAPKSAGQSSLGLIGIRERAALLGGSFHIEGAPGAGTFASVEIPLKRRTP